MNTQDFKRKLTAVFSADVAGYSRLMGEDEAATVRTLSPGLSGHCGMIPAHSHPEQAAGDLEIEKRNDTVE